MVRTLNATLVCLALALVTAALAASPAAAQQKLSEEQRCTGGSGITADTQITACTALIDGKRLTRQNLAVVHTNRGVAHAKTANYSAAIADFDAALRINPNYARATTNRGSTNFARRDFDAAVA